MQSFIIRPATAADQNTITTIIQEAKLNTASLDWQRFMLADDNGRVIGTGQIKPHWDGTRELASISAVPDRQGEGVASAVIHTLLKDETDTLYLMCETHNASFYERFGFRSIPLWQMPPYLFLFYIAVGLIFPITLFRVKGGAHISIMKRTN